MRPNSVILTVILFLSLTAQAQVEQLQEVLKTQESEIETESVRADQAQENYQNYDAIEEYLQTPLQLNNSSEDRLFAFPFFNENQVKRILAHKLIYGDLIAVEELQVIEDFDADFIRSIKPLLSVGKLAGQKAITPGTIINEGSNTIMIRMQKNIGSFEDDSSHPGSNEKIYFRYKYQLADRIRIGLTAEKDPGEAFFGKSNPSGFDFYSGHLIFKSRSFLRQVTLGDYAIQHGQGLVMWSGMGFGKSSEVLNIQKNANGIRPYTSVDENNFLRGISVSTQFTKWKSDLFFSSHKKDANMISKNETEIFSAFQTSGYHRTEAELEDRKSINEMIAGASLNRSAGNLKYGAIVYFTKFSTRLNKETSLYNQYEFQGDKNLNYGMHGSYLYKNVNTFAEIGRSKNGGMAFLWGSVIHLHPKLSYSIAIRNYRQNYQSLQSAAFSENTKTANEYGIFSSAQIKLPKNLSLSAYTDYFVFPWLKFGVDAPSAGYDYLLQLKWKPKRTFETYFQFKTKVKQENADVQNGKLNHLETRKHSSLRLNVRIKLSETWEWGSRLENTIFKKGKAENQHGLLLYQDLIFHPLNSPISLGLRYAIFDTDDYDTRIYAYENDVLFSYSIPAMQGRGERMYINLRYRISRMIDLWIRYAISKYEKENPSTEIPTGQNDPKKELKVQLRLQF